MHAAQESKEGPRDALVTPLSEFLPFHLSLDDPGEAIVMAVAKNQSQFKTNSFPIAFNILDGANRTPGRRHQGKLAAPGKVYTWDILKGIGDSAGRVDAPFKVSFSEIATPFSCYADLDHRNPRPLTQDQILDQVRTLTHVLMEFFPRLDAHYFDVAVCRTSDKFVPAVRGKPQGYKQGVHLIWFRLLPSRVQMRTIREQWLRVCKAKYPRPLIQDANTQAERDWAASHNTWEDTIDSSVFRDQGGLRTCYSLKPIRCCSGSRDARTKALSCIKCKGAGLTWDPRPYLLSAVLRGDSDLQPDEPFLRSIVDEPFEVLKLCSVRRFPTDEELAAMRDQFTLPVGVSMWTEEGEKEIDVKTREGKRMVKEVFAKMEDGEDLGPKFLSPTDKRMVVILKAAESFHEKYRGIQFAKVFKNNGRGDGVRSYFAYATKSTRYCLCKRKEHQSSVPTFHVTPAGIHLKCSSQKGGEEHSCSSQWEGVRSKLTREQLRVLFPQTFEKTAQYDVDGFSDVRSREGEDPSVHVHSPGAAARKDAAGGARALGPHGPRPKRRDAFESFRTMANTYDRLMGRILGDAYDPDNSLTTTFRRPPPFLIDRPKNRNPSFLSPFQRERERERERERGRKRAVERSRSRGRGGRDAEQQEGKEGDEGRRSVHAAAMLDPGMHRPISWSDGGIVEGLE